MLKDFLKIETDRIIIDFVEFHDNFEFTVKFLGKEDKNFDFIIDRNDVENRSVIGWIYRNPVNDICKRLFEFSIDDFGIATTFGQFIRTLLLNKFTIKHKEIKSLIKEAE